MAGASTHYECHFAARFLRVSLQAQSDRDMPMILLPSGARWMTTQEVAEALQMTPEWVAVNAKRGRIRGAAKFGHSWRFRSDILAFDRHGGWDADQFPVEHELSEMLHPDLRGRWKGRIPRFNRPAI